MQKASDLIKVLVNHISKYGDGNIYFYNEDKRILSKHQVLKYKRATKSEVMTGAYPQAIPINISFTIGSRITKIKKPKKNP